MRELKSAIKTIVVLDANGDKHKFFCKIPSLEDRIDYRRKVLMSNDEDKVKSIMIARIEGALKILQGFEKGTLCVDGKVISSDSNDADYYSNWKELLRENCVDILEAIAIKMYELGAEVMSENFFTRT